MSKKNVANRATVMCRGEVHEILVMEGGALVLRDHPNIEEERALYALSGDLLPWCIRIMDLWRRRLGERTFPKKLRSAVRRANRVRLERKRIRESQSPDPLIVPPEIRRNERIKSLALKSLVRAHFGVPARLCVEVRPEEDPHITGHWGGRRWGLRVQATIRPSWTSRVNRRGIALVGGHFVLDVLEERPNGDLIVLAGRMGRDEGGPTIRPYRAIVTNGRLHWLE